MRRQTRFHSEGQGFKTAGMCPIKTWVVWAAESPQGNSVRTTAFPQPEVISLKINLGDPHALRIVWERMLLNPATICPVWVNEREGKKREMFLPPLSRSLIGHKDEGNPQSASPRTKAYRLQCISIFLIFADFRKDVHTRANTKIMFSI